MKSHCVKRSRFLFLVSTIFAFSLTFVQNSNADNLVTAQDHDFGYSRSYFNLWIDADKNGCNTRAEVLIEEAIIKPKIGKNCSLVGGKWVSLYDGKTFLKSSELDIDHTVPLAEAWKSGAWAWTDEQRQMYANDIRDPRVLIAVSASQNRSKSDSDVSKWLPPKNVCTYISNWIAVKLRYSLTVDNTEANTLNTYISRCGISNINVEVLQDFKMAGATTSSPSPAASSSPSTASTFKMPFILGDGKLGNALSKWAKYGFINQPTILQEVSGIKTYGCKPISNEDWISKVSPKWGEIVSTETKVTITVMCNLDFNSTSIPNSSPSNSQSSQSRINSPSPITPSISPAVTPTTPVPASSPSATTEWPTGATAKCKDGTYSTSQTRSGTCSGHGGVLQWK